MGSLYPYFLLLRPQQWLKNLMLFFPPFLAGKILGGYSLAEYFWPFLSFSLLASSSYIVNDLLDLESDRKHPAKRYRPLAAGRISRGRAACIAVFLTVVSLCLAAFFVSDLIPWLIGYFVLSVFYSTTLKKLLWVDLLAISAFFLIRLEAGGAAFDIKNTPWLYLSVFLLALFLSTGKRLSELHQLGALAGCHRMVLLRYSSTKLNILLYATSVTVLITYFMYCIIHKSLLYSVPLCAYGLYRYICRVQKGEEGDPTTALLKDPQLLTIGVSWCVLVICALY
jgi:4-hydroxybenzoate polyprenyltransferase